jgi:hypothetical protein
LRLGKTALKYADEIPDIARAGRKAEGFGEVASSIRMEYRVSHIGHGSIEKYGNLLKKSTPMNMERHKLLEWRVAKYLGFKSKNDVPAVFVVHSDHTMITKMLRDYVPYGSNYRNPAVSSTLRNAYAEVYGEGSEWFKAIERYLP